MKKDRLLRRIQRWCSVLSVLPFDAQYLKNQVKITVSTTTDGGIYNYTISSLRNKLLRTLFYLSRSVLSGNNGSHYILFP